LPGAGLAVRNVASGLSAEKLSLRELCSRLALMVSELGARDLVGEAEKIGGLCG